MLKRIIASIICLLLLSEPMLVFADIAQDKVTDKSKEIELVNGLKYNKYTIDKYYSEVVGEGAGKVKTGKVYFNTKAAEVVPTLELGLESDVKMSEWPDVIFERFTPEGKKTQTKPNFNMFGVESHDDDFFDKRKLYLNTSTWKKLKPTEKKDLTVLTFGDFMLKLSETYADEEIKNGSELNAWLSNLDKSQGGSGADLSNLNQRMAAFMYKHLAYDLELYDTNNGQFLWSSTDDIDDAIYATWLSDTLSLGHSVSLRKNLKSLGLIPSKAADDLAAIGKVRSTDESFSVMYLGALAYNLYPDYAYTEDDTVGLVNFMCMIICLDEYIEAYNDLGKITENSDWKTDEKSQTDLIYMHTFHEAFAAMVPLIEQIYHLPNADADDMSMSDMYNELDDEVKDMSIDDAITVDTSEAQVLAEEDLTSPISQFYQANQSAVGITGVNRDEVLNDVQPDREVDNEVKQLIDADNFRIDTTREDLTDADQSMIQTQRGHIKTLHMILELSYWESDKTGLDKLDDKEIYKKWESKLLYDIKGVLWDFFFKEVQANKEAISQTPVVILRMLEKEYEQATGKTAESMFGDLSFSGEETESEQKTSAEALWDFITCRVSMERIIEWAKTKDIFKDKIKTLEANLEESQADMDDIVQAVNANVSSDGTARGYGSVVISDFIRKGMALSATYIPMCTMLDNVTTEADLRSVDDTRFEELYYRFGSMRKALQIDISASSALDYYTAGGRSVGTARTATLRDLVESGNNDVTLYIDRGLYNTEKVKEEGTKILEAAAEENKEAYENLRQYQNVKSVLDPEHTENLSIINANDTNTIATDTLARNFNEIMNDTSSENTVFSEKCTTAFEKMFSISIEEIEDQAQDVSDYIDSIGQSLKETSDTGLTDKVLKAGKVITYDENIRAVYSRDEANTSAPDLRYTYHNVSMMEPDYITDDNKFVINEGISSSKYKTFDNKDSLTLSSYYINKYLGNKVVYDEQVNTEQGVVTNSYETSNGYTPVLSLAYISCLYRDSFSYHVSTANGVMTDNPVFMASKNLIDIPSAGQWYRNSFLNYVLMKNLKGMSGMDATFMSEMDCPIFMDIFGNIVTQSNRVVIPAACNATLHTASYYKNNYALGLYKSYGKSYYVPWELEGAASVLGPMFEADQNTKTYVLNGISVVIDGKKVNYRMINDDDAKTKDSIQKAYLSTITKNNITRLNWMAMVNIANEVMRGAPFEYIDFENEVGLNTTLTGNAKSGLVAAAKLENLLAALKSNMANTLIYIPDFTKMENLSVYFAFLLKILIVVLTGVIMFSIYRDAVSVNLGWHTVSSSIWAVALTVIALVGIPAVFHATYYSVNKILLEDETYEMLMTKEEKRQIGEETGVTAITSIQPSRDFLIQLDWLHIPWYKQFENAIFGDLLNEKTNVLLEQESLKEGSSIFNNEDVTIYRDGVYMNVEDIFDSVQMDYTFNKTEDKSEGARSALYLYSDDSPLTFSYYSPYYVFLRSLTENINEFNDWRGTSAHIYQDKEDAETAVEADTDETACYSYTTKYVSGNRRKTVGLCNNYFSSEQFMQEDRDILRLNQIYMAVDEEYYDYDGKKINLDEGWNGVRDQETSIDLEDMTYEEYVDAVRDGEMKKANPAKSNLRREEESLNRGLLFDDSDRQQFMSSYWYNDKLVESDIYYMMQVRGEDGKSPMDGSVEAKKVREEWLADILEDYYNRVDAMDDMLREFVTKNRQMLTKVTDETFIKVTALAMSIYYNQLFGVPTANSVELYNMSSEDILRLCVAPDEDVVLAAPLSYPRFVYNYGGTPAVYAAAFVSIILWIGSYIKPLCTIFIFLAVFVSIFVFRVILRKPSANIWGYCETVLLLCFTNVVHALMLKLSMYMTEIGLSATGCLIFTFVAQLVYLVVLAWVVSVSIRDWQNLGAGIYEQKTVSLRNKFKKDDDRSAIRKPRLDNNWDYYNNMKTENIHRNMKFGTVSGGNAHTVISDSQV